MSGGCPHHTLSPGIYGTSQTDKRHNTVEAVAGLKAQVDWIRRTGVHETTHCTTAKAPPPAAQCRAVLPVRRTKKMATQP